MQAHSLITDRAGVCLHGVIKEYQEKFIRNEKKGTQIIELIIKNKAISMMRGKSPPSELILEIIKSNNSLSFFKRI